MARKKDLSYTEYEAELARQIREQKFYPCTLICGSEDYLRTKNTEALGKAILGDGDAMNFSLFHGSDVDVGEVLSLAQTLPFFSEHRVIVLEETGFFAHAGDGAERLSAAMADIPETTFFIFNETQANGTLKLYKAVKKYGWVMKCDTPDEAYLRHFVNDTMRSLGMPITAKGAGLLLSYTGEDMLNIQSECRKLADYCYGRPEATDEDVRAICCITVKDRIFDMMTAIVGGDQKKALEIYMELVQLQTAPQVILALMLRQFNQLLQVGELFAEGKSSQEVAGDLHLNPWALDNRIRPLVRGKSAYRLQQALQACVQANMDYRSGKISAQLATEKLIITWSRPGALANH